MGAVCSGEIDPATEKVEPVVDTKQEVVEEKLESAPTVQDPVLTKGPTVKVVMARGLKNADWTWIPGKGVSDAYVLISVGGKEVARTAVIPNTLEPIFNQELEIMCDVATPEKIDFDVYDKDPGKPDDKLGHCSLLKKDYSSGFNGEIALEDAGKGIKAFLKVMVKLPGSKTYPSGPSNEFKVTLKKEKGKPIGFEADVADPTMLFISDGFTGPAKEHNDKANPTEHLKKMQYIVEVNGVKGDGKKMLEEVKKSEEVTLLIRRPMLSTIAVDKKGAFGLVLSSGPSSAYVSSLVEGKETVIKTWNAAHKDKAVKAGDRIVSVNSKQGTGTEITNLLKSDGPKQAVICRPCDPTLAESVYFSFF
jgi:hypothetical protein